MFKDRYASALANGVNSEVDVLTDPEASPGGDRGVYRAIFSGMQVHGLPPRLQINGCDLHFVQGPVLSQRTEVAQRAGIPLIFDKSMKRGIEVGTGQWLTVAEVELNPLPKDLSEAMATARERAQTAAALASCVLDERLARELLSEDVIIIDGERPVSAADRRELVRSYLPFEAREIELQSLRSMEQLDLPRHVETAARWYLRGVQSGPGVDGVIFLWFAVEAMVGTSKKKPIEEALLAAGRDPADQAIGVGQLHGIRSKFVHDPGEDGKPPPPRSEIRQAFYDLEAMVRALLRHASGVRSTWPAHSASRPFDQPWRAQIEEAWANPEVEFHHELPGSETEPVSGLSWSEMLPAIETRTTVAVTGGQGQDAQRIRRIIEMALVDFDDPDLGEFPVEISRLPDEGLLAECHGDRLLVSSRIVDPKSEAEGVNLMRLIHIFMGRCLLTRRGVASSSPDGWFLHGILSGWMSVHFLATGGVDPEAMTVNPLAADSSPFEVGEQLGAAGAGSKKCLANIRHLVGAAMPEEKRRNGEVLEQRIAELAEIDSPSQLLDLLFALRSEA